MLQPQRRGVSRIQPDPWKVETQSAPPQRDDSPSTRLKGGSSVRRRPRRCRVPARASYRLGRSSLDRTRGARGARTASPTSPRSSRPDLTRHQIAALFRQAVLARPRIGWYADPGAAVRGDPGYPDRRSARRHLRRDLLRDPPPRDGGVRAPGECRGQRRRDSDTAGTGPGTSLPGTRRMSASTGSPGWRRCAAIGWPSSTCCCSSRCACRSTGSSPRWTRRCTCRETALR